MEAHPNITVVRERLGGIHRNSFINSPTSLNCELRVKSRPKIHFAGQVTGCEGYVGSAAIGILAARFTAAELPGEILPPLPPETTLVVLLAYIFGGADAETLQPMNINFQLYRLSKEGRREPTGRRPIPTAPASPFAQWQLQVIPTLAGKARTGVDRKEPTCVASAFEDQ